MKRFALVCALAAVAAGVQLSGASAASFDDTTPCPAENQFLVCPTGLVGAAYSLQLVGKGGCDLYRWEVVNSSLPAGLSLSQNGLISGTPTSAGSATFWVIIHDLTKEEGGYEWCAGDNQSQRQYVISIDPGLSIKNQSVKPATIGQAYSETLTAAQVVTINPFTGSDVPAAWSVQSGTLPPGVTLSPEGVLAGTPTEEGTFQFVVHAQNGAQSDIETLTIGVRQPVAISSPFASRLPPRSEVGVPFSATLQATGGNGTYTWALASGVLPEGVLFATDGTITGTPAEAGRFPIVLTATDGEGRVGTLTATLDVAAELALDTLELPVATAGRLYRTKLAVLGGVQPLTWTVLRGTLPPGIRLEKKLGSLAGTSRRTGIYRLTIEVVDALGVKSQARLTLIVTAKLSIKTLRLRVAKAGVRYRAKLAASGGVRPLKWMVVRGKPPLGVRLAKKRGLLIGKPRLVPARKTKRVTKYRFTVRAVDALGVTSKRTLVLLVTSSAERRG